MLLFFVEGLQNLLAPPLGELDSAVGRRLRGRISADIAISNRSALSVTATPCHHLEWFRDFIAGVGTGLAIVEMIAGLFWTGRCLGKR